VLRIPRRTLQNLIDISGDYPNLLCSFTFDGVSQLDQDASVVLATIREWRNSFIPINRVPLDILPLIPTHLSPQDRLRASFVCRHWRRTFLQYAELWSQLSLSKGEVYIKTLLKRAKGSPLDVIVDYGATVNTIRLLSSHTEQIKYLYLSYVRLMDIRVFSEANPGRLPLLHTLGISGVDEGAPDDSDAIIHPCPLLFKSAVNLKDFRFRSDSDRPPCLNHFVFPTLTSFDLSAVQPHRLCVSQLLDFLEASPMLQTVHMRIAADISLEGVPQERVVVLPNVQILTVDVEDDGRGYEIAPYISCPSAIRTSLTHEGTVPEQMFPPVVLWDTIVRQYSRSPVEEATVEVKTTPLLTCDLTFRSADGSLIELRFNVIYDDDPWDIYPTRTDTRNELLTRATKAVTGYPQLLAKVKHLRICYGFRSTSLAEISRVAKDAGQLFKSVGPLDQLTIFHSDLRPYLHSFLDLPEGEIKEPVVFPPIKELTISYPLCSNEECTTAIVGLAKSQHKLGIPFERVTIRRRSMLVDVEEGLRPWVGSVECCYDEPTVIDDTDDYFFFSV
jgi:hypothetical protein